MRLSLVRHGLLACLLGALIAAPLAGSAGPQPAGASEGNGLDVALGAEQNDLLTAQAAPTSPYPVGERSYTFHRGDRPLPTLVWYPATPPGPAVAAAFSAGVAATAVSPVVDSPAAAGRFPLLLFSHGVHSAPANFRTLCSLLAAAGFVVAAPAYPHTSIYAAPYDYADIPNQPLDASWVIDQVLRLSARSGDPLAGRVDASRIGAVGHSAGGYTTAGLLSSARDRRVRAAVILSGAGMGDAPFVGPRTAVLYLHGDADPVVAYSRGRATFDRTPWPKAFLTIHGQGHGEYLISGRSGFSQSITTMVDFLRWTLYGDPGARERLDGDAYAPGVTSFDDRLG